VKADNFIGTVRVAHHSAKPCASVAPPVAAWSVCRRTEFERVEILMVFQMHHARRNWTTHPIVLCTSDAAELPSAGLFVSILHAGQIEARSNSASARREVRFAGTMRELPMNTLALFLFGMAMSLAGFLLFNLQPSNDRMTIEIARMLYSVPMFFGGLCLAAWAVLYGLGWVAPEMMADWKMLLPAPDHGPQS
jgi:hypothetical protein